MAYLTYIDDQALKAHVKNVLDVGRRKKTAVSEEFQENVIDPFATLFDSAVSEINHDTWKKAEMIRQCQKALTNHIGNLHQRILGSVNGWQDQGVGANSGIDLICEGKKIIAEIKNKHNTVTFGNLAKQYQLLEQLILPKASQYKGYTAYFVNIIPKTPERFDKPFTPSDKEKGVRCVENDQIRIIDGASFYSLVTGRANALEELYDALPVVIEDVFRTDYGQPKFTIPDKVLFKQYFKAAYGV